MRSVAAAALQTPDGVFTVLADDTDILASGWTEDAEALLRLVHPSLQAPLEPSNGAAGDPIHSALEAVQAYYDGDHALLGQVPVRQRSGPFRQKAWDVLRTVAPGSTLTYTTYAAQSGSPNAVRAAAGACAANAAALFVPCHRIIRTDGSLGGFRYGVQIKQSLLRREGALSR